MGSERTVLERFRAPQPEAPRTTVENTGELAESVMANLRRLLNSRHGLALARPDYGIPDLCDSLHSFPDAIEDMRKAIKTSIESFEPRLRRVTVKHVSAPEDIFSVHFEITAELVTEREKASVWIATRVDGSGEVRVEG